MPLINFKSEKVSKRVSNNEGKLMFTGGLSVSNIHSRFSQTQLRNKNVEQGTLFTHKFWNNFPKIILKNLN